MASGESSSVTRVSYPQLPFLNSSSEYAMLDHSTVQPDGLPSAPSDNNSMEAAFPTECGKCQARVMTNKCAFVTLACGHLMHTRCFLNFPFHVMVVADDELGGHRFCGNCVAKIQTENSFTNYIDRSELLKALKNRHTRTTKYVFPVNLRADATSDDLLDVHIDAIVGRSSRTAFFRSHADYDKIRLQEPEDACELLRSRQRTFTAIFDNDDLGMNLYDLYRFGVKDYASLRNLGFSFVVHCGSAWQRTSPLWMLHELYDVGKEQLFEECSAEALLASKSRPEEYFLCDVTMRDLVQHGCSKEMLFAWGAPPDNLIKYMGLDLAICMALCITPADFQRIPAWKKCITKKICRPLYIDLGLACAKK